jgi:hypothetical protein
VLLHFHGSVRLLVKATLRRIYAGFSRLEFI